MSYELRNYQRLAVDSTWGYLCNRPGNPVIVAPTGAGKSLIIAELAKGAAEHGRSVLVLAHRKELLVQNAEKIRALIPQVPIGIYSAGLRKRDTDHPVILAGIQSVYSKAYDFGERHLILVDEAHLIPDRDAGMYSQFFADMRTSNPAHRTIGLTATPYRLDSGMIYDPGQMFDAISHQIEIGELIQRGYLCQVTAKPVTQVDTSGLHHRGGEFIRGEVEQLFEGHVVLACRETVDIASANSRRSVLIFASGVEHATHVADLIERTTGEKVGIVTGDTLPLERESTLSAFRSQRLRWLVNVDVLTTGFDAPNIDCISVMRATESPGLFAQIVGRGFRISPGKSECLLLDFGGNLQRHGPLDAKDYGKRSKPKSTGGEGPTKTCPACEETVPAGLRECPCGFRFPAPARSHADTADKDSAVLESQQEPERWTVEAISVGVHTKKGSGEYDPKTFRVNYECRPEEHDEGNLRTKVISEWVCVEHDGFARKKAENWWRARCKIECPTSAQDAVDLYRTGALADTVAIETIQEGKYHRIRDYQLGPVPDGQQFDAADEWEEMEVPF